MTALLVIANLFFAASVLAGVAAVCRLGHRLGSGHHDHRVISFPRREHAASAERKVA